jgi:hypothetical protein
MELKANTTAEEFKIIEDNKDEPDLKSAQEFVGGMVECITFPNGDVLIVNEEGKLMNLPLNVEGTALWSIHLLKTSMHLVTMTGSVALLS